MSLSNLAWTVQLVADMLKADIRRSSNIVTAFDLPNIVTSSNAVMSATIKLLHDLQDHAN
jgi:hypothetical protein